MLGVRDQSGSQDSWSKYVEFNKKHRGYATFSASINGAITDITVDANYRGPATSTQKWTFQLRDFAANSWLNIGTNVGAPDWGDGKLLSFSAPGALDRFVSASEQLQVRLVANNSKDNADIDYLAVTVASTGNGGGGTLQTGNAALSPDPVSCEGCWRPAVNTRWNWVIAHAPTAPFRDVQMYDIDGFEATAADVTVLHNAGIKAVCYVDGGTSENWRPDFPSFPAALKGSNVDGWAGEKWLDIRDVQKPNSTLASIMNARLQMCADKGFDMVEWDNMDGYQNSSGFPLTANDQLTFNQFLFNNAHALGMSVLLKNDVDQVSALLPYVDGTLNEECNEYNECNTLAAFVSAGKPVFNAEYQSGTGFCSSDNTADYNGVNFALDLDDSKFQPCR